MVKNRNQDGYIILVYYYWNTTFNYRNRNLYNHLIMEWLIVIFLSGIVISQYQSQVEKLKKKHNVHRTNESL